MRGLSIMLGLLVLSIWCIAGREAPDIDLPLETARASVTEALHAKRSTAPGTEATRDSAPPTPQRQRGLETRSGEFRIRVVDHAGRAAPFAPLAVYSLDEDSFAATQETRTRHNDLSLDPVYTARADADGHFAFSFGDLMTPETTTLPTHVAVFSAFPARRPGRLVVSLRHGPRESRLVLPPTAPFEFSVHLHDGRALPSGFTASVFNHEEPSLGRVDFALPPLRVRHDGTRYAMPFVGHGTTVTVEVMYASGDDVNFWEVAGPRLGERVARRRLTAAREIKLVRASLRGLASLPADAEDIILRVRNRQTARASTSSMVIPDSGQKVRRDARVAYFLWEHGNDDLGAQCEFDVHIDYHEEFSTEPIYRTASSASVIDLGDLDLTKRVEVLEGIVTNDLGQPVQGATIEVLRRRRNILRKCTTRSNGTFTFEMPIARLDAKLRCQHPRHANKTIAVAALQRSPSVSIARAARAIVEITGAPERTSSALLSLIPLEGEQLGHKTSYYVSLQRGRGRVTVDTVIPVRTDFYLYLRDGPGYTCRREQSKVVGRAVRDFSPGQSAMVRIAIR